VFVGAFWEIKAAFATCSVSFLRVPAAEKLHMAFNLIMVRVVLRSFALIDDLLVFVLIVCLRGWNDDALLIVAMGRGERACVDIDVRNCGLLSCP
jgi:hypothetical protein